MIARLKSARSSEGIYDLHYQNRDSDYGIQGVLRHLDLGNITTCKGATIVETKGHTVNYCCIPYFLKWIAHWLA